MKLYQLLAGGLASIASGLAFATRTPPAQLPWDEGGMLAIAAGGLALGIWIVRRKKDK
jgi:hypothetical protein